MKKVLIIGIDSFTGKHLQSYLEKYAYDVYGTTHTNNKGKNFQCDISKKEDIKKIIETLIPEYIINLAAVSFVDNEDIESFYTVNIIAVENILSSIIDIENYFPRKVILASSATIYGNQDNNVLDELMTPNPISHYGISKLGMECLAKTYFDKINIIITRPFNYIGVGQADHFLTSKIVSHFKHKKTEIELGNINVYREFNDIEFVCESYKRFIESDIKSEIINIASNRLVALNDILIFMSKIAGYKINVKINSKFVRKNEIVRLSGSHEKLYKLVGKIDQKELIKTLKDMYND